MSFSVEHGLLCFIVENKADIKNSKEYNAFLRVGGHVERLHICQHYSLKWKIINYFTLRCETRFGKCCVHCESFIDVIKKYWNLGQNTEKIFCHNLCFKSHWVNLFLIHSCYGEGVKMWINDETYTCTTRILLEKKGMKIMTPELRFVPVILKRLNSQKH